MEETKRIAFGNYMPDLAPLANPGLVTAQNTVPIQGGYDGINALADLATFTTIAERPRGAIAGIERAGNPYNFVGTETKIYSLLSGTTDASGGTYNCRGQAYWEAAVFGRDVIFVNPNDDPQYMTIGVDSVFKRLRHPTLERFAPRAKTIGVLGTFVILGNTYDPINGLDESAIHWSALNDHLNWPDTGTEQAVAVQSDRQPLSGDGGAVQRVVSGAEVGAIFQERSIWRADYRGGDVVFELNRVEPLRGLMIPAIAVPFGRMVFYLSEDGFYLFDYTQSVPIGREIVDRTFLADIDTAYFDRVSAVADPCEQRIWILYPGAGNTAGVPNKVLVYDWGLNRFSGPNMIDAEWIAQVIDAGLDLDSPDTAADPDTDGVDGAGLPSFDERQAAPGSLKLGAWSTTPFTLQDFTGSPKAAVIETGRREVVPGSRSLVTRTRLLVDGADVGVQCRGVGRANASANYPQESMIDEDGDAPLRVDARYHQFRCNLRPGFSNALGADVYAQRSGRR